MSAIKDMYLSSYQEGKGEFKDAIKVQEDIFIDDFVAMQLLALAIEKENIKREESGLDKLKEIEAKEKNVLLKLNSQKVDKRDNKTILGCILGRFTNGYKI